MTLCLHRLCIVNFFIGLEQLPITTELPPLPESLSKCRLFFGIERVHDQKLSFWNSGISSGYDCLNIACKGGMCSRVTLNIRFKVSFTMDNKGRT